MEKQYYALTELTERWDFCLHDALYLAGKRPLPFLG